MAGDGSVIISAHLDDEQAQREIKKLRDAIKKTEEELTKKTAEQSNIKKEMDEAISASTTAENSIKRLNAELSSLKSDFALKGSGTIIDPGKFIQAKEREAQITSEIQIQEAIMKSQDKIAERLGNRYAKITDKVTDLNNRLEYTKEKIGAAEKQLNKSNSASHVMQKGMEKASESAKKFTGRIKTLALRIMVFSVIARALRSIASYMNKVIKSNDEAAKSIAQLKGALITLAQPIIEYVIPAITKLIIVLSNLATKIASVVSSLFGKTIEQSAKAAESLYNEANALDSVSKSAEDASEGLAGFDEINQIGSEAQGTVSKDTSISPSFDFTNMDITPMDELLTKLGAAAALTGTLALKFGETGAAIGLIAGGTALAIDGFKGLWEEGFTVENQLETISGLMAAGLGISIMTGSWIPLLVAGIASIGLALLGVISDGEDLEGYFQRLKQKYLAGLQEAERENKKSQDELVKKTIESVGETDDTLTLAGAGFEIWWSSLLDAIGIDVEDLSDTIWGIGHQLKMNMLSGVQQFVFHAKKVLNELIDRINDAFTFKNPLEGSGLDAGISTVKLINLPHLAQGAVIPPNRQFTAVLGDQKSGTNVEAPLSTIKQALIEALRESGGQDVVVQLNLDGKVIAKSVVKNINAMTQQAGRSVLKI